MGCIVLCKYTLFGEMAEWIKATVLKTVEGAEPSVGSNPTLSANSHDSTQFQIGN